MARLDVAVRALCACTVALAAWGCRPRAVTLATSADGVPTDPWSRGVYEYNRNCAGCHGENGEGDEETPPLVGDGAWPETRDDRDATFVTAADAFAYTKAQMPPMDAGSLSDDQYWVILYYVLKENGRALPGTLDASNAADIKLR